MRVIPLLLLILLAPAPTLAAPGVLYGPDLDSVSAALKAEEELGNANFVIAGPLADRTGRSEAVLVIGAPAMRCSGDDGSERPLAGVMVAVREEILNMDYGPALERLDAAVAALPCRAEDASADELYSLFFLQGFVHFNEGREDGAREAFRRAAAIDPSRPWGNEYPPKPKEVYLEALQEVAGKLPSSVDARVDAVQIDGAPFAGVGPVRAGGHLFGIGGEAWWVEVPPAEADRVVVVDPARLDRLLEELVARGYPHRVVEP